MPSRVFTGSEAQEIGLKFLQVLVDSNDRVILAVEQMQHELAMGTLSA